jgi:hypothetical protein
MIDLFASLMHGHTTVNGDKTTTHFPVLKDIFMAFENKKKNSKIDHVKTNENLTDFI